MGNLFSRNQPISEIKMLRFAEMRDWNIWHERMLDEDSKIICGKCNNTYDVRKHKRCPCGGG